VEVLVEVVVGEDLEHQDVGLVGPSLPAEEGGLVDGPPAAHPGVDDLDGARPARRQEPFEPLGIRVLRGDPAAVGERVA